MAVALRRPRLRVTQQPAADLQRQAAAGTDRRERVSQVVEPRRFAEPGAVARHLPASADVAQAEHEVSGTAPLPQPADQLQRAGAERQLVDPALLRSGCRLDPEARLVVELLPLGAHGLMRPA